MPYEWLRHAFEEIDTLGIEPYEVVQVLGNEPRHARAMRHPGGLPVLAIWGRTNTGRPLAVLLRHLGRFDWMIIGARELTAAEKEDLEKWESER